MLPNCSSWLTDRWTDGQRDRHTDIHRDRQTYRESQRNTGRRTVRLTNWPLIPQKCNIFFLVFFFSLFVVVFAPHLHNKRRLRCFEIYKLIFIWQMLQKCCRLKIQTEGEREGSKGKRGRRETERSQCDLVLWNESLLLLLFFLDICLIFGANYYTFNIGICVKLNLIAANDAHCFPPLYTPFPPGIPLP